MNGFLERNGLVLAEDVAPLLARAGLCSFDDFMNFSGGTRICHKRGRSVYRLEIEGRAFYLKRNRFHYVEFLKGLSRFRLPARGARQEWLNLLAVRAAGVAIPSPIAFGEKPLFGLETCSFTVTEELYHCRPLDQVIKEDLKVLRSGDQIRRYRQLTRKLGNLARRFHESDMYHQDFYLSHFYVGKDDSLFLIDLQRVLSLPGGSQRYQVKDLGQLNYAAQKTGGISRTDRLRFLLVYLGKSSLDCEARSLVKKILNKTARIARHDVKLAVRRRKRGEL